jgi:hypothetical protein
VPPPPSVAFLRNGLDRIVAGLIPGVDGVADGEDYFCIRVGDLKLFGEGVHG